MIFFEAILNVARLRGGLFLFSYASFYFKLRSSQQFTKMAPKSTFSIPPHPVNSASSGRKHNKLHAKIPVVENTAALTGQLYAGEKLKNMSACLLNRDLAGLQPRVVQSVYDAMWDYMRLFDGLSTQFAARWSRSTLPTTNRPHTELIKMFPEVCLHQSRIGNVGDGGKVLCGNSWMKDDACSIFSLGSANEFSFEYDALNKTACAINTFDCTSMHLNAFLREKEKSSECVALSLFFGIGECSEV